MRVGRGLGGVLAVALLGGSAAAEPGWEPAPGLEAGLTYTAELFRNTHGGIRTTGSWEYRGDVSLVLTLDTAAAGWWSDGAFFAHLQQQHGDGITEDYVGDFQVLSNIDADDFAQVSELWYRHSAADGRVWIKLGKQDATADFAAPACGTAFIHSSPGFSPTIPLATYPDPDWGVVLGVQPLRWLSVHAGLYQGRPDGGRSLGNTLRELRGPMLLLEPGISYAIGGRPGSLRIGGWWNGDQFDALDRTDPAPGEKRDRYGWYVTWDQLLWSPPARASGRGIGLFAQYGWAPDDRSEARQYLGAGFEWTGPLAARERDTLGFGLFHVDFSKEAALAEGSETAMELFYAAELFAWLRIQADAQYIIHPGGSSNTSALPVGLRVVVSF
jgi:porin